MKETVTKESEKKSKDDKDSSPADGVKATNTVKLGIKRPGPVTTFGFGKKKKQSGITIQLQSQVCASYNGSNSNSEMSLSCIVFRCKFHI